MTRTKEAPGINVSASKDALKFSALMLEASL
jgi:hypothetical protein